MAASPLAVQNVHSNTFHAQNVNILTSVNQIQTISSRRDPMEILHENVAFGALYNSAERYDPPKCHPQTRTAILDRIERWAGDSSNEAQPILWLNGPAGAGKSAIVQTLVERWKEKDVITLAFFFWRTSSERNQKTRLVATIGFQLLELLPSTKSKIEAAINTGGLFERSISFQLDKLVIELLSDKARGQHPVVIVIDGLDECCTDVAGQNYEDQQKEILDAFGSACKEAPSLRLLIASRPERQIRLCFGDGFLEEHTYSLSLSNVEDAPADIRLFLDFKFQEIRKQNGIGSSWPTEAQLSELVKKSSGQFIYPSVTIKHITRARANPIQSLKAILELQAGSIDGPLAELDKLYTLILESVSAESLPVVIDILGYFLSADKADYIPGIFTPGSTPYNSFSMFERFLFLSEGDAYSHLTDLHSVMDIPPPTVQRSIRIIHATFSEYLQDKSRSAGFFIDHESIAARYVLLMFRHLREWDLRPKNHPLYNADGLFSCTCDWILDCPRSESLMVQFWSFMRVEIGDYPLGSGHHTADSKYLASKQLSTWFVSRARTSIRKEWMRRLLAYLQKCNVEGIEPSWLRRQLIRRRLESALTRFSDEH